MDNLHFIRHKKCNVQFGQPLKACYQHATKTILILNSSYQLHFITYSPQNLSANLRSSTQAIQQLESKNIILLDYIVDAEAALVLTENGEIMVISQKGVVDIKAQNDDGISGGSLSPTQQYVYVVTKNNILIQLNMEFDLVKQVPLDDHETQKVDSYDPRFSWKVDGSFFALNILTNLGRKCHTRDNMLGIFRSPSKSDPQPEGVVQSISQKSRQNMSPLVAWQPSAGIIAGADYINKNGKKVNRVIFWQKNGLRHLQFQLPLITTDVLNLTWSPDSLILAVQVLLLNSQRWVYLYHRSNYHWYLKHTLRLENEQTQYFLIKNKYNQIITMDGNQIQTYEYVLQTTEYKWKSEMQQQKQAFVIQASADGNVLKITDFSLGLIPPPMCHFNAQFQTNIHGLALYGNVVLVVTQKGIYLCRWNGQNLDGRIQIQVDNQLSHLVDAPVNLRILRIQPEIQFCYQDRIYRLTAQNKIKQLSQQIQTQHRTYSYGCIKDGVKSQVTSKIKQSSLFINDVLYAQHCTSFAFYHEFLIFTVSSSGMYDKMFILDLQLDQLNNTKDNIKIRLEEMEAKKLLNFRVIQRGAKIISCCKNRVIFQLPRGNLQAIYPKVITIKHVNKCMRQRKFKQAFQTVRTHKLDLNLLYDVDPRTFTQNAQQILLGIKRTDYLNLFVSQLKDEISTELQYCKTQQQIQQIDQYNSVKIQGRKTKQVCEIVSKTLRKCDRQKYILTIYTSDIKMGLLDSVLFQIKDMKKNDVEVLVPPHLQQSKNKKQKLLNSQQILEYVCWLVDANVIYEASLLTYDLQLASITARCTQMDPKQYIPYLEELKQIADPLQLRRRICMDLKKYEKAVIELSNGNQQQINSSIELVRKHKLYKCGLKAYGQKPKYLKQIKHIIIDQLISTGQSNQAYKMCLSIQAFQKALEIAISLTDGKKIKQAIQCCGDNSKEQKVQSVRNIIKKIGVQGFKNKSDLAKLKAYIGQYAQASILYIKSGNYQKAYKYYVKTSQDEKKSSLQAQFKNGMALLCSLQKNQLIKDKQNFLQKSVRLHKIHKQKSIQGPTLNIRNVDNDDLYSQVSVSSKAASEYTISTTTGLRKKRDKKRSILSRNVKQGSPLEQQYLVAFIVDLQSKVQTSIKQTKLIIQHLIYMNMIQQAELLRNTCKQYAEVASKSNPKFYAQVKFQSDHPQFMELLEVYQNKGLIERDKGKEKRDKYSIDSFNYMF